MGESLGALRVLELANIGSGPFAALTFTDPMVANRRLPDEEMAANYAIADTVFRSPWARERIDRLHDKGTPIS